MLFLGRLLTLERAHQAIGEFLRVGSGLVDLFRIFVEGFEPAVDVRRPSAPVVADTDLLAGQWTFPRGVLRGRTPRCRSSRPHVSGCRGSSDPGGRWRGRVRVRRFGRNCSRSGNVTFPACQWQPKTAHLWQPKTAHFWGGTPPNRANARSSPSVSTDRLPAGEAQPQQPRSGSAPPPGRAGGPRAA